MDGVSKILWETYNEGLIPVNLERRMIIGVGLFLSLSGLPRQSRKFLTTAECHAMKNGS